MDYKQAERHKGHSCSKRNETCRNRARKVRLGRVQRRKSILTETFLKRLKTPTRSSTSRDKRERQGQHQTAGRNAGCQEKRVFYYKQVKAAHYVNNSEILKIFGIDQRVEDSEQPAKVCDLEAKACDCKKWLEAALT